MTTDPIGRHEALLPINHKSYNFRENRNSQLMKQKENLHLSTDKGDVNILRPVHTYPDVFENGDSFIRISKKSTSTRTL